MTRQVLPERRYAETFTLNVAMGDYNTPFQVSVGYFPPDLAYEVGEPPPKPQPAEVFIMGPKAGSSVEAVARDASVILSIALQYGAPVEVLQHSITRNPDGTPSTIMGAVLDHIAAVPCEQEGPRVSVPRWSKLPLALRQRYWRETDFAKRPPSDELRQAVDDAVKAMLAEDEKKQ